MYVDINGMRWKVVRLKADAGLNQHCARAKALVNPVPAFSLCPTSSHSPLAARSHGTHTRTRASCHAPFFVMLRLPLPTAFVVENRLLRALLGHISSSGMGPANFRPKGFAAYQTRLTAAPHCLFWMPSDVLHTSRSTSVLPLPPVPVSQWPTPCWLLCKLASAASVDGSATVYETHDGRLVHTLSSRIMLVCLWLLPCRH